jgi:hypothetical protein
MLKKFKNNKVSCYRKLIKQNFIIKIVKKIKYFHLIFKINIKNFRKKINMLINQ